MIGADASAFFKALYEEIKKQPKESRIVKSKQSKEKDRIYSVPVYGQKTYK